METPPPNVGGRVTRRDADSVGRFGVSSERGPPAWWRWTRTLPPLRWPDCPGPLSALGLESCLAGSLTFGTGASGGPPNPLLSRGACVCVCAPSPGLPGLSPRPAGAPFPTSSLAPLSTSRRCGRVLSLPVPSAFTAVPWAQDVFTSGGRVLLTAAFRLEKVCAHPVRRFQLLLVNGVVKPLNRKDEFSCSGDFQRSDFVLAPRKSLKCTRAILKLYNCVMTTLLKFTQLCFIVGKRASFEFP